MGSSRRQVTVVEECVFDRGQASHKINLFDIAMKYVDVISLKEAVVYVRGLPDNLFVPALRIESRRWVSACKFENA